MAETYKETSGSDINRDRYMSTNYSNNISCGICGAPIRNVPVMYEHMNIDWRCSKCLRRDKPSADDND